jgi:hypothetical protein
MPGPLTPRHKGTVCGDDDTPLQIQDQVIGPVACFLRSYIHQTQVTETRQKKLKSRWTQVSVHMHVHVHVRAGCLLRRGSPT